MVDDPITALSRLMDRFAREHWDDRFSSDRARLSVDGDALTCSAGSEAIRGHASAPLLFVTGAWGLIYAHECERRFGHRVDGRINRVWPNGAGQSIVKHKMDAEVATFAAHWPPLLFSSSLYRDVATPGRPRRPRSMEDAPSNTSLTGILKRIVKSAGDAQPLERLKAAEFIEDAVRAEWSFTAEDAMMKVVGQPLMALVEDKEPAIREVALLALETCAQRCWEKRAYGLYEPICRRLIDAGLNAHLQYVRLAESAYAAGDIEAGDRLWEVGAAGQNPRRAMKLGSAYDHIGDWSDLRTRVFRQAGGAHVGYAAGVDPNEPRQAQRAKRGITPPDPGTAGHHRTLARTLLARAAQGADARLAVDLPAIGEGKGVPLGPGEVDPSQRRLFLSEIFLLQSRIAEADGDQDERLRLLFKALRVEWQLRGSNDAWRAGYEDDVVSLARERDDATLERLGMPDYLKPLLRDARRATQLAGSPDGQEQLFWQRFMLAVRQEFLATTDLDSKPLPGAELASGFVVTRDGGAMSIAHEALEEPVHGPLSAPVITALRAWHGALRRTHGAGAWLATHAHKIVTFGAEDVAMLARIAAETLASDAKTEAIALYRFAHGTDPLLQPWPYRNPVPPLPIADVPVSLREAVMRRSPLEATDGHAKLKPRGRRIEQLARDFEPGDALTARYIGQCLRDACGSAADSEIGRAVKSGQPLLLRLWQHPDPQVREIAIIAIFMLLHMQRMYYKAANVTALLAAAQESGIADIAHVLPEDDPDDTSQ